MARPVTGITAGLLAGSAGATALQAVAHLHQAIYGTAPRPSDTGEVPSRTAGKIVGGGTPGTPDKRRTRIAALGPLGGIGVGVGVGAVAGALRGTSVKVPFSAAATTIGLAAMAVSDGAAVATKSTRPDRWTPMGVLADLLPHLAYGAVTTFALHRLLDPRTPVVA